MRRVLLVGLVLLGLSAGPATAQDAPPPPPGGGVTTGDGDDPPGPDDDPVVQLDGSFLSFEVGRTSEMQLTSTRSGGVVVRCGFYDWTGPISTWDDPALPYERDQIPWVLHCWYPTGDPADTWSSPVPGYPVPYVCCPDPLPPAEFVDDWEVAEFARNSIDFGVPTPELSPSVNQVVGVPTWLAVTNNLDFPSVSAAADSVWVTITPEFREVEWDFGNGEPPVICTVDVATTWDPELDEDEQSSSCTHTFTSNGDGTPLAGTVTVRWNIWMESHRTTPGVELWGVVATPFPVVFDVRELQAVID